MLMLEAGKARIVEQQATDSGEVFTLCSNAGDTFSIPKPNVSDELLDLMMAEVREIIEEERSE